MRSVSGTDYLELQFGLSRVRDLNARVEVYTYNLIKATQRAAEVLISGACRRGDQGTENPKDLSRSPMPETGRAPMMLSVPATYIPTPLRMINLSEAREIAGDSGVR